MSALIGENKGRAGLPTFLPEGTGEYKVDAKSSDVITQGLVVFRDIANATEAERVWKLPGTGGGQVGPAGICTKTKIAGELKVTVLNRPGQRGLVTADADIEPEAICTFGTTTNGRVMQAATQDPTGGFCRYVRRYKFANDGDGNHAKVKAVAGDLIEVELI